MKILGPKKYEYTAELWDTYSVPGQNNADGTPVLFYYKRVSSIPLNIAVDSDHVRVNIYADVPFGKLTQIRNVRNSYGEELLTDAAYLIRLVNPNLNALGKQEGYYMVGALAYAGDYVYEFEEDKPAGAI